MLSIRSAAAFEATATALALWLLLALVPCRTASAANVVNFRVPAGPAADTLRMYTTQTGLQVLFGYDDVRGIETHPVHGLLDVRTALEQMTKGTRLRFEFMDEDTVTLTVVPEASKGAARANSRAKIDRVQTAHDRRSLFSEIETVTVRTKPDRLTVQQDASPLVVLTQADIRAFRFSTVHDVLATLPQVFGGGPTEDTRQIGFEARTNAASGAGINLRGLGAGSTLVLVNGRRLAGGGTEGIFTDVSSLPLSLIDRIEILPDSSSTVYGADAVGGVVNFVLIDTIPGAQTEASYGAATRGQLSDNRVSQLVGFHSRPFDGLIGLDFYARDDLPSADREQARSDLTSFGGDNFDAIQSNPATIVLGNELWGVPHDQDGKNLTTADLIPNQPNRTNRYANTDLLPTQQRWTAYFSGKKRWSDAIQLFGDALYSERDVRNWTGGLRTTFVVPSSNPFSPFSGVTPVEVAYDFTDDLGAFKNVANVRTLSLVGGSEIELAHDWHLTATADFGSERLRTESSTVDALALSRALADPDPATALNVFGDGSHTNPATLAGLRSSSLFIGDSQVFTANLTARRELPGLWNGVGKLVAGMDYREQSFNAKTRTSNPQEDQRHDLNRRVGAGFVALSLPILGPGADTPARNRLEASLAARYEHYSDFGHIITPRLGLTWSPSDLMKLRANWSRSFRPPNLLDLDESSNFVTLIALPNSAAPNGQSLVLLESGKNAHLREERARSFSAGVDLDVPFVPGLSTALTYFHTHFTDRMNQPAASATLLSDPFYAAIVTHSPSSAERAAFCQRAPLINIDAATCLDVPVDALVDLRVRNSELMRTTGIDLLGEYQRDFAAGSLTWRLDGTYIFSFAEATAPGAPLIEKVSTQNNPIDLRLRSAATWRRGSWSTSALVTYYDDYRDIASEPARHVDSWTTFDFNIAYTTGRTRAAPLSGITIAFNAENAFDRHPPFLNNQVGLGYDQENGDLLGRVLSLSIRKDW
ncbi:MAG TPA: TonB-dependent receptor [Steroidobacteraceae bacterium]|nr:TonB-dependent receptor [Steroidobacteraceae bacterium]